MVQQYLKKLGQNIKNVRRSKKLSQEKLAELIGKSRNYIGMIERAEVNTPSGTVFQLAIAMNVDIKCFFENIQ